MLKKLSNRSVRNIKCFLNCDFCDYMRISKHDMKILFEIYEKSIFKMMEYEEQIDSLKKGD